MSDRPDDREREFRDFFQAEFEPLRGLAFLLTGDWAEAEDLAQEAMVRTYGAWGRIKQRDRPGLYARSVMVNRRRSLLRRALVERKHADRFRAESYAEAMPDDDFVLWAAVRALPARQRAALVLRFFEDLPEREVAQILDIPVGTLKSRIHRGLERLRDRLGPDLLGPEPPEGSTAT